MALNGDQIRKMAFRCRMVAPSKMIPCLACGKSFRESLFPSHADEHFAVTRDSYNEKLLTDLRHILPHEFMSGIAAIVAAYAAVSIADIRPPPAQPLGPKGTVKPTELLRRPRFEDEPLCRKTTEGELLAGMKYIVTFGAYLESHSEFGNESYLRKCLSLYIKFLSLQNKLDAAAAASATSSAAARSGVVLVPNVAVDVWWSAHLIRPSLYAKFCMHQFGRMIDRPTLVHTHPLTSDQSETAKLWRAEYNEPYDVPTTAGEADAKSVSASDCKSYEERGLVAVSAVIKDRKWLSDLRSEIGVKSSTDSKLTAQLGRCPKGHALSLYKTGVVPAAGYEKAGRFDCDRCDRRNIELDHYYHCDTCTTEYDVCKLCIRKDVLKCTNGHAYVECPPNAPAPVSASKTLSFKCFDCNTMYDHPPSDSMTCKTCKPARMICDLCSNGHEFASHCLLQYNRFWFFCWRFPESAAHFTPPQAIDWVWHSAQLHPVMYARDCDSIAGGLIDHSPWPNLTAVEEDKRESYVRKMWVETFGLAIDYAAVRSTG